MQKLLMRRKAELETQLRPRPRHRFRQSPHGYRQHRHRRRTPPIWQTQQSERFTILGAWDSDPENNLVSYLSPVAQSLIGHKVATRSSSRFMASFTAIALTLFSLTKLLSRQQRPKAEAPSTCASHGEVEEVERWTRLARHRTRLH